MSRAVWYGFRTWTPAGREEPEHGGDRERRDQAQHEQLSPADTNEEEDREQRHPVHEGRPEVGLEEDEHDRTAPRPSADRIVRHRVTRPARSTRKPAMASTNSTLPSLGRLELDDSEVEPALRAANRLRGEEHDEHEREGRPVHHAPVAAGEVDRHEHRGDHRDDAEAGCDALANDEVASSPGTSKRVMPETTDRP